MPFSWITTSTCKEKIMSKINDDCCFLRTLQEPEEDVLMMTVSERRAEITAVWGRPCRNCVREDSFLVYSVCVCVCVCVRVCVWERESELQSEFFLHPPDKAECVLYLKCVWWDVTSLIPLGKWWCVCVCVCVCVWLSRPGRVPDFWQGIELPSRLSLSTLLLVTSSELTAAVKPRLVLLTLALQPSLLLQHSLIFFLCFILPSTRHLVGAFFFVLSYFGHMIFEGLCRRRTRHLSAWMQRLIVWDVFVVTSRH